MLNKLLLECSQSCSDTLGREGDLAQPYSCGIEDGVGYRRSGCYGGGFAGTHRWLTGTIDQHDFDFWYFREL